MIGRIMPLQSVATRVLFYPTLLYNVVMEKVSSRKWYDRIDETVILGALPFRGMSDKPLGVSTLDIPGVIGVHRAARDSCKNHEETAGCLIPEGKENGTVLGIQLIKEENVRGVITMNEEYETRLLCHSSQQWESLGVEQLRLSTVDFTGVPSLENLQKGVEFVHRHQEKGHSVYIHCKAGRSRSATMVAAYLIERHRWDPDVASAFIANIRPHILIRSTQHQILETFYLSLTNSEPAGGGG